MDFASGTFLHSLDPERKWLTTYDEYQIVEVSEVGVTGGSSDQVLQMPIAGRPPNWPFGMPWLFIQLRWLKPS